MCVRPPDSPFTSYDWISISIVDTTDHPMLQLPPSLMMLIGTNDNNVIVMMTVMLIFTDGY